MDGRYTPSRAAVETTLFLALEQAMLAAVLIDEQDRVVFYNQAAERLWGYTRDEVLGQNLAMLIPAVARGGHDHHIAANRETGLNRIIGTYRELTVERKDGSEVAGIFALSKVAVGDSWHYLALVRNFDAELRQRNENYLLSLVVNETDRAVFVLDESRRIVYVNRAFTDLFGYAREEASGKLPTELLASPNTDPRALDSLREDAWLGRAFQVDVVGSTRDGGEVWVSCTVNPVRDAAGKVVNLVGVLSDITERQHIDTLQRALQEALAQDMRLEGVMDLLCRQVESAVPGVVATVVAVDEHQRLRPLAGPRMPSEYHARIDGAAIGPHAGNCGTAAWRGTPVIVTDIATDPLWTSAWRDLVLPLGLRACWSSPIKRSDGQVAGSFAFYFPERRGPTPFEIRVVEACLPLCMIAIEHEENRRRIAHLAQFDPTTGLPNRAHTYQQVERGLRRANDVRTGPAVFILDLDHFKDVNEQLGPAGADRCLRAVARRLQTLAHQRDGFVGRIDGDTFLLVVQHCDTAQAAVIAQDMLRRIKAPFEIDGQSVSLSGTLGVSMSPENGTDSHTLITSANLALHQGKVSGRGYSSFASAELNQLAAERRALGSRLRGALSRGELSLHYQPQICLHTGDLHGAEALARWYEPEFGQVSPGRFIPLAEELGEIEAIGAWSLGEACRQLAAWRRSGLDVPALSVNLSARHFRARGLPAQLDALLREYDLPPASLVIEITESEVMSDESQSLDIIGQVRELGVGVSMDDFGTGFSSLARLSALPVTELKIDRSFLQDIERRPDARALASAAVSIGQSLGLTVVAEGVETDSQRGFLAALGCDVAQGYLYSAARPAADFEAWWRTRFASESAPQA